MAKKRVGSPDEYDRALGRTKAREHADIIHHYARKWETHDHRGKLLENIRVCPPKYFGDAWLVVLKAWEGDAQYVAFHRGQTMLGTLAGAFTKLAAGTLSWTQDRYAK